MSFNDNTFAFRLKIETAAELYGLLRKEDGNLSSSLQRFLEHLEKELMNNVSIEELEDWIER